MGFEKITTESGYVRIINLDQIVELEDFKDFSYNTLKKIKETAGLKACEEADYNLTHNRLHNGSIPPSMYDIDYIRGRITRTILSELDENDRINKLWLKLSNGEELVIANFTIEMFLNCEQENYKQDIKNYGDFVGGLNGNRK